MKAMGRNFKLSEKLLLLFLALILLGLGYYWFVDRPIRESISRSRAEADALWTEKQTVQLQYDRYSKMQEELDDIRASGTISRLGSYNNSEQELRELNNILSRTLQYTINFADVTREGNLIRRLFTLQFRTPDYETAREVLTLLGRGEYRCIVDSVRCMVEDSGAVTVNATATFYETMVGGTPDAGLPMDQSANQALQDAAGY